MSKNHNKINKMNNNYNKTKIKNMIKTLQKQY